MAHGFDVRVQAIKQNKLKHEGVCTCERCNRACTESWEGDDSMKAEVDHKIPLRLGGANSLENLQILCRQCHASKTRLDRREIAKAKRVDKGLKAVEEKKFTPLSAFGFEFVMSPEPKREPSENQPEQTTPKDDSTTTSEKLP